MELSEDGLSPPEDRNMNRKTITNICTIPPALFLVLIGIVHSMVNFSGLRRALARGEIAARLGDSVLLNAVFSGLHQFAWARRASVAARTPRGEPPGLPRSCCDRDCPSSPWPCRLHTGSDETANPD